VSSFLTTPPKEEEGGSTSSDVAGFIHMKKGKKRERGGVLSLLTHSEKKKVEGSFAFFRSLGKGKRN